MKLPLKFVGVLAIVLIAAQPVTAGCMSGAIMACAPGCPMNQAAMAGMSSMVPDCPMMNGDQLSNCSQSCSLQTPAQAIAKMVAPEKPRPALANSIITLPVGGSGALNAFAFLAAFTIPAPSPPRYILNQVFRI